LGDILQNQKRFSGLIFPINLMVSIFPIELVDLVAPIDPIGPIKLIGSAY
jgi:hypothetical protein